MDEFALMLIVLTINRIVRRRGRPVMEHSAHAPMDTRPSLIYTTSLYF